MNPVNPRPTRYGLEPLLNDTRADRWLNSTGRTAQTAAPARPTADDMRSGWQHHVEPLRRWAWTTVAVAAILIAFAVGATVAHGRFATRCAPSVSAMPVAVTP
ncbi:hypothetical protein GCM10010172_31040 [Paractinoplanes ferrugineus]|uniref:Uncharacterized protein n=1 Tax=Paractinoplanes ferrugineus TaxID=113564 RepID=A0A919J5Y7_9ACTN|nr:hypothetical protein [Actinoplanes ferrugineus]GIE14204.1 hypothetical protein Afe05nite_60440 [Actinoplanes ferrugineus]